MIIINFGVFPIPFRQNTCVWCFFHCVSRIDFPSFLTTTSWTCTIPNHHLRKSLHIKWPSRLNHLIAKLFALTRLKHFSVTNRKSLTCTLTGKVKIWIEVLYFVLDILYVLVIDKVSRQVLSIPTGTNCANWIKDLFLCCFWTPFVIKQAHLFFYIWLMHSP